MDQDITVELTAARRRNEQWLAAFLMVFAGAFTLLNVGQLLGGSAEPGSWSVIPVCVVYLLYYRWVWSQVQRRPSTSAEVAVRTVAEVSIPLLISLLDARLGADHALPRVSVVVWALAIFASVLRLRPRVSLFAGAVAATEWMLLWAWLAPGADPEGLHSALAPAMNRAALFGVCGVLSWQIARMQLGLTERSVSTALERERVRRAFGTYLPEPVVQRILDGQLRLGTERRPVTVLFVDIRSFTSFSESRSPDAVLDVLNEALEAFSAEVAAAGGFVNKYLGDGLMAIFGAPADQPDHTAAAVRAGIAIAEAARRLSDDGVYPGLRIGVGLHTGEVVVGDIGGGGYREYTAIGDVVNVASRVEGQTKSFPGVTVIATAAVREHAPDQADYTPLGEVKLGGRDAVVELFGVSGRPS